MSGLLGDPSEYKIRRIQLGGRDGMFAIVDAEDYERLSVYAWCLHSGGYAFRNLPKHERDVVLMHREVVGAVEGQRVDHRNRDKLDNRKENLRFCTVSQNGGNMAKHDDNPSRYKGVSHGRAGKWRARIRCGERAIQLGTFDTQEEAAAAYDAAARRLFGDFARTNFPEPRPIKKRVFRGVRLRDGGWHARISYENKERYLGTFGTEEEAARAYDKARRELFGDVNFTRFNFPDDS